MRYGTARSPKPPRLFKVLLSIDPPAGSTPDAMLDTLLAALYSGQQQITVLMHNGTSRYGLGKCIGRTRASATATPNTWRSKSFLKWQTRSGMARRPADRLSRDGDTDGHGLD